VAAGNDWTPYNTAYVATAQDSGGTLNAGGALTQLVTETGGKVETINFSLDGQTKQRGSRIAFVVLRNVSQKDANKLSAELNGSLDDSEEDPEKQLRGRLIYHFTDGATNSPAATASTDVYYCLNAF
jgi:hypothetical protein